MNDEHDKLGAEIKRALETQTSQLSLVPGVRRQVIAAAERKHRGNRWPWCFEHRLALAGVACALIAIGVVLQASRPDSPHRPEPYMQIRSEVHGGRASSYWKRNTVQVHARNGHESFIKIEATWPKRTGVIAPNMRREG